MTLQDNDESAEQPDRHQGTSSVRVAIGAFLITLLVLAAMGVYWLTIRVV